MHAKLTRRLRDGQIVAGLTSAVGALDKTTPTMDEAHRLSWRASCFTSRYWIGRYRSPLNVQSIVNVPDGNADTDT